MTTDPAAPVPATVFNNWIDHTCDTCYECGAGVRGCGCQEAWEARHGMTTDPDAPVPAAPVSDVEAEMWRERLLSDEMVEAVSLILLVADGNQDISYIEHPRYRSTAKTILLTVGGLMSDDHE